VNDTLGDEETPRIDVMQEIALNENVRAFTQTFSGSQSRVESRKESTIHGKGG